MYNIGICDDGKVFCGFMESMILNYIKENGILADIKVWFSGEGLCKSLKMGDRPDILFLDIELLQKNGIEIGAFIRDEMEDTDTHIVYISSKQGYAMELFKMQPLEFLVKPISPAQLKEVLERSMKRKKYAKSCFEYQRGSQVFRVSVKEILYFMSMDKKILMIKKDGQEQFYGKLKNVMEQLPAGFLMIHQSYIIHQEYVSEYSYESIKMINGDVLSVSKPYRKEVRAKIKQYLKRKMYNDY